MKTEKEKMLSNELYNHKDAELTKERNHAYELTLRYNQTKDDETELRTSILQQLAGKLGNNVVIKPPFQCDYGYNLILGDNVFMNYGCSILDCNVVEMDWKSCRKIKSLFGTAYRHSCRCSWNFFQQNRIQNYHCG